MNTSLPIGTICPWCGFVFDGNGDQVDPRPTGWERFAKKVCHWCTRLEAIRNAGVANRSVLVTAEAPIFSNQKVQAGRSCLPPDDRD